LCEKCTTPAALFIGEMPSEAFPNLVVFVIATTSGYSFPATHGSRLQAVAIIAVKMAIAAAEKKLFLTRFLHSVL